MRRSVVGLMSVLLAACATIPDIHNQTQLMSTQITGAEVYPPPVITISATPIQANSTVAVPSTLRPMPTSIAAPQPPTISPNITPQFVLSRTLPITSGRGPHYLAGWSPDDSRIVYTAIGAQPGMAEIYILNVQSGVYERIADDAFLGLRSSTGVLDLEMAAPRWILPQNQLIISKLKPNGKQAIVITDTDGTVNKTITNEDVGAYTAYADETLIIVSTQQIKTSASTTIAVPKLVSDALLSFRENGHNKFAFLPQPNMLHIAALNDSSYQWNTTPDMLKTQSKLGPDIDETRLRFKNVVWSSDGTQLAFWLGTETDQELWIADENGINFVSMLVIPQSRGGHIAWSPDGTMLAFTVTPTGAGANEYISLNIIYIADRHSEVVDTGVQLNPVWNAASTQIAIEKNGVSIVRLLMHQQTLSSLPELIHQV